MGEFRSRGFDFIQEHFDAYEKVRLKQEDAIPVFERDQAKKFLKHRAGLYLSRNQAGGLILEPLRFRKLDLGGWVSLGEEYGQSIPWPCTRTQFWKCFDAALADAS